MCAKQKTCKFRFGRRVYMANSELAPRYRPQSTYTDVSLQNQQFLVTTNDNDNYSYLRKDARCEKNNIFRNEPLAWVSWGLEEESKTSSYSLLSSLYDQIENCTRNSFDASTLFCHTRQICCTTKHSITLQKHKMKRIKM